MKRLLTADDFLSMKEKENIEYQNKKFSAYVKYQLYPNSPYFRKLFKEYGVDPDDIKGIEDWHTYGLPLITKAEYRENLQEMVINPWEVEGKKRSFDEVLENYVQLQKGIGELEKWVKVASLPQKDVYIPYDIEDSKTLMKLHNSGDPEDAKRVKQVLSYAYSPFSVFFTGGTTGMPTPITSTRLDRDLYQQSTIIMMMIAGSKWMLEKTGKVVMMTLYPYAPHQGWWVTNWGAQNFADFFIPTSGGGVMPPEALAMILARFQVNALTGMPGFVRNRFLKKALELKEMLPDFKFPDYMILNLGGEKIIPRVRNEMKEMLHKLGVKECKITGAWGASESRFNLLGECDTFQDSGYHSTGWDKVAYRIVKMKSTEDWEFADHGEEGYVVQFPMDGAGTLIEGFLLGDKAVQLPGACPVCGSYVERFVNPLRADELDTQLMVMGLVEQKIKGASVNLTDLRTTLMDTPEISELQVVVTKKDPNDPGSTDVLKLNVVPIKDLPISESELIEKIKSRTKAFAEITPEVELFDIDTLMGTSLKLKTIWDQRPKN